jgi:hypothetical protein
MYDSVFILLLPVQPTAHPTDFNPEDGDSILQNYTTS